MHERIQQPPFLADGGAILMGVLAPQRVGAFRQARRRAGQVEDRVVAVELATCERAMVDRHLGEIAPSRRGEEPARRVHRAIDDARTFDPQQALDHARRGG